MAPALRVAEKIQPYFILALGGGPATAFGLGFVWPDFPSQRRASVYVDTPWGVGQTIYMSELEDSLGDEAGLRGLWPL